jgi:hypothetical protein
LRKRQRRHEFRKKIPLRPYLLPIFAEFLAILLTAHCWPLKAARKPMEAEMNSPDASMTRPRRRGQAPWQASLAVCGICVLGFTAALPAVSAQAQFLRSWGWHPDEGPPPIPPDDVGQPSPPTWHATAPAPGPMPQTNWRPVPESPLPISVAEIRHRASLAGFHLIGMPHLKAGVYVAFGEDAHGALHHLAFDAFDGTLIENERAEVTAKAVPTHPAPQAVTPTAVAPTAVTPTPAAPAKPAAATPSPSATPTTPSVEADDLSPIKPQPGVKLGPKPTDPNLDKD